MLAMPKKTQGHALGCGNTPVTGPPPPPPPSTSTQVAHNSKHGLDSI